MLKMITLRINLFFIGIMIALLGLIVPKRVIKATKTVFGRLK